MESGGDLRKEFEQYVEKLTKTISKEIYLEDLKGLYAQYKETQAKYEHAVSEAEETTKVLSYGLANSKETMTELEKKMSKVVSNAKTLEIMTDNLKELEAFTKDSYSQLADRIDSSNKTNRELIDDCIKQLESRMADTYANLSEQLDDEIKENKKEIESLEKEVQSYSESVVKYTTSIGDYLKKRDKKDAAIIEEQKNIKEILDNQSQTIESLKNDVKQYYNRVLITVGGIGALLCILICLDMFIF